MSHSPEPAVHADSDELIIRTTTDDLRQSRNVLHFGTCSFFLIAWRIYRPSPRSIRAVGSLYTHSSGLTPGLALAQPRCILGSEPAEPARLRARLLTTPDGPLETWTVDAVSSQAIELELPAVPPWVPTATIVYLRNRRQVATAVTFNEPCPPK